MKTDMTKGNPMKIILLFSNSCSDGKSVSAVL